MSEVALLSTVALLEDLPEKSLQRGQVGTIVEVLTPGVYEVEFSDNTGSSPCFCRNQREQATAPPPRVDSPRGLN